MWRDWTTWARAGVWLAAVVVFFVVMAGVGWLAGFPAKAFSEFTRGHPVTGIAIMAAIMAGLFVFARTAERREQRRRLAETGVLDVPRPPDTRWMVKPALILGAPLWIAVVVMIVLAVVQTVRGL